MFCEMGSAKRNSFTRRSFLQIGAPALGLTLPALLRGRARAADTGKPATKKSLIVFWTHGGLSQQDTWDMKPEAPAEYRGYWKPVSTRAPGVQISELLPYQAKVFDKLSVVRSVWHKNGIHAPSAHWMSTGYFGPTLARNAPQRPSFGSVIARAVGSHKEHMPGYVTIPKSEAFGYQGSVYLGAAYNPFEVGANPNNDSFKVPNLALPGGLDLTTVQSRRDLLTRFDTLRRDLDSNGSLDGLDTFKAQALEMVAGQAVREAFDISREDPKVRDRYGRHQFGQSALLARRLVEAGSACVTVNTGYWDHHDKIREGHEGLLPPLDQAIGTLVADLDARGMLDDVMIYSAGEFGRTPLINGHAGRDHWAPCFSVLFGGGGVQGGRLIGASEKWGGNVDERPATPLDVLATIYYALGIPLDTHYEDASGRPVSIVDAGKPIYELF